jgi:hypothetical protein
MDYLTAFRQAKARLSSQEGPATKATKATKGVDPPSAAQPPETTTKTTETTKGPGPCPGCGGPLSPFAECDTATATYRRGFFCGRCGHETERPPETAEAIQFEPAPHPSPTVFWESRGRILGPARVVAFAKAGEEFWLLIEHGRESRWIRDTLLRSKRDYETQRPLRAVEPIREAHRP